jgi:hypothetical protein
MNKSYYGIPRAKTEDFGLHLKKMGKYQYWCVRYREGTRWKAKPLRARTIEDARILRDVFYNYMMCYGLPDSPNHGD